jgi:hypothetical protein
MTREHWQFLDRKSTYAVGHVEQDFVEPNYVYSAHLHARTKVKGPKTSLYQWH